MSPSPRRDDTMSTCTSPSIDLRIGMHLYGAVRQSATRKRGSTDAAGEPGPTYAHPAISLSPSSAYLCLSLPTRATSWLEEVEAVCPFASTVSALSEAITLQTCSLSANALMSSLVKIRDDVSLAGSSHKSVDSFQSAKSVSTVLRESRGACVLCFSCLQSSRLPAPFPARKIGTRTPGVENGENRKPAAAAQERAACYGDSFVSY